MPSQVMLDGSIWVPSGIGRILPRLGGGRCEVDSLPDARHADRVYICMLYVERRLFRLHNVCMSEAVQGGLMFCSKYMNHGSTAYRDRRSQFSSHSWSHDVLCFVQHEIEIMVLDAEILSLLRRTGTRKPSVVRGGWRRTFSKQAGSVRMELVDVIVQCERRSRTVPHLPSTQNNRSRKAQSVSSLRHQRCVGSVGIIYLSV